MNWNYLFKVLIGDTHLCSLLKVFGLVSGVVPTVLCIWMFCAWMPPCSNYLAGKQWLVIKHSNATFQSLQQGSITRYFIPYINGFLSNCSLITIRWILIPRY